MVTYGTYFVTLAKIRWKDADGKLKDDVSDEKACDMLLAPSCPAPGTSRQWEEAKGPAPGAIFGDFGL